MRLRDCRHSRHGDGYDAVLAANGAPAFREIRHHHVGNAQMVEADGSSHDVSYGVDRAHLVEMHLVNRASVRLRLGLRENLEYAEGELLGTLR